MYCRFYSFCKEAHHRKSLCRFTFIQCKIYKRIVRENIICEHGTFGGKSHCIKCTKDFKTMYLNRS